MLTYTVESAANVKSKWMLHMSKRVTAIVKSGYCDCQTWILRLSTVDTAIVKHGYRACQKGLLRLSEVDIALLKGDIVLVKSGY